MKAQDQIKARIQELQAQINTLKWVLEETKTGWLESAVKDATGRRKRSRESYDNPAYRAKLKAAAQRNKKKRKPATAAQIAALNKARAARWSKAA